MTLNKTEHQRVCTAVMAPLAILTSQYFVLLFFDILGGPMEQRVQLVSKIVVALVFLYAFPVVWRKNRVRVINIYLIFSTIFLIHYLMFPENRVYIQEAVFPFFFMCLPSFIYSRSVTDWEILMKVMVRIALFVLVIGAVLGAFIFSGRVSFGGYSMAFSYYMLLPAIVYTNKTFEFSSKKNVALAAIATLIVLALGARGPLLCLAAFVFLKLIQPKNSLKLGAILGYLALIIAGITMVALFEEVLLLINDYLLRFGIKSRSISLFLRPDVHLSGRDKLYEIVIEALLENPLVGLGLLGDRVLINTYVHNFFIEIFSHFGIVIGFLLLISLLFILLKNIVTRNKIKYDMLAIWTGLGLMPLMVSSSYLINLNFWVLLGLLMSARKLSVAEDVVTTL